MRAVLFLFVILTSFSAFLASPAGDDLQALRASSKAHALQLDIKNGVDDWRLVDWYLYSPSRDISAVGGYNDIPLEVRRGVPLYGAPVVINSRPDGALVWRVMRPISNRLRHRDD